MRISKNDLKKIIIQEALKFKEKDSSYYEDSGVKNAAGSLAMTALMSSPAIFSHLQQIMRDKTMNLVEAAQYMILHFPQEAMHMIELLLSSDSNYIHEQKIIGDQKQMKILKSQLKRIIKEELEKMAEAGPAEGKQLYWVKYKEKDGSISKSYMAVVDSEEDMRKGLAFGYIWHGFKPADSFVAVPMTPEEQARFMAPDDSMEAEMYGIRGNVPRKDRLTYERPRGSLGS